MNRTIVTPQAVLFDWDNTLVDSWPVIHQALHHTFAHMEHEPWTLEEVKERVGKSMRDAFPALFGSQWEEAADMYRSTYRSLHREHLKPFKGAKKVLQSLQEHSIPMALVSNKMGDTLRLEVTQLGWDNYFHAIIGATDAAHDKPHPAPVLMALEQMNISPSESIWFIGDSEVDLEVAKAAGLQPHLYGNPPAESLKDGMLRGHEFYYHYENQAQLQGVINSFV